MSVLSVSVLSCVWKKLLWGGMKGRARDSLQLTLKIELALGNFSDLINSVL